MKEEEDDEWPVDIKEAVYSFYSYSRELSEAQNQLAVLENNPVTYDNENTIEAIAAVMEYRNQLENLKTSADEFTEQVNLCRQDIIETLKAVGVLPGKRITAVYENTGTLQFWWDGEENLVCELVTAN